MKRNIDNLLYENAPSIEDPEILIVGYGKLTLSQTKDKVKAYIQEMSKRADREDWLSVSHFAYRNGVLQAMLQAINKYYKDLEASAN
jgi:hypothetical protein